MASVQWDCYECQQIFPTKVVRKKHGMTSGHQWIYIPGKAVPTTSNDRTIVHATIGEVRLLNGRYPVCPVCQCHYEDDTVLLKHWQSYENCEPCNVHLLPSWSIQAHYSTSDPHPKCQRCGFGFKNDLEYTLHLNDECFLLKPEDAPTPGPSGSSSLQPIDHASSHTETPFIQTGYGWSSDVRSFEDARNANDSGNMSSQLLVDSHAAGELHLDAFETQVLTPPDTPEPSTVRRPAPGHEEVAVSNEIGYHLGGRASPEQPEHNTPSPIFLGLPPVESVHPSSVSNYSREASGQSGSVAEESSTYSARIRRAGRSTPSSPSHSAPSTPRISSFSASLMCSGASGPNGARQRDIYIESGRGHTTTAVRQQRLWHCRLCERNPCELPVTTMCGHIFCHSCIVAELDLRNPCCPICKREFFVPLRV